MTDLQNTSWDNTNIYKNFQDPQIQADQKEIELTISLLNENSKNFEDLVPKLESLSSNELQKQLPLATNCYRKILDTRMLLGTMRTYASTTTSVDALNYEAKNLLSQTTQLWTNLNKASKALELFLLRAPDSFIESFLAQETVDEVRESLIHAREKKDLLLSVEEEIILEGHGADGFHAWGQLYSDLSGTLKVSVNGETMGLAQASSLLFQSDRKKREAAHVGINRAWQQNEVTAGAILNSITGWRIENVRARSKKRELHYLDEPCHQQKISRKVLSTLMDTAFENRKIGQKALRLMAQTFGVQKLGPWDLLAPYPNEVISKPVSFPDAMKTVERAFTQFNPEMGQFARMMYEKNWIDGQPTPNRKTGAYCTGFSKVREPRVFMTFEGSMKDIITLAHELGHAYHNWVMRDLKYGKTFYTMTLAETASTFAETLVRETLLEGAQTTEEKKAILWQDLESAASFLINIPARFDFESQLMEKRKQKSVTVPEMKSMTVQAWEKWYGDTLSESNDMFWASKLHFAMTQVSFYNYPYLFGFLFSLGIYSKKTELGADFKNLYTKILRDTGILSPQDLIQKHFGQDISKPDFWVKSIQIVERSIANYEKLMK